MTTLLISGVFPPKTGGSARWFWEIYNRFPRDEYIIAAGETDRPEEVDRAHNLRVFRLPLDLPSWGIRSWQGLHGYWRAARRIRHIVKSERVNRIHCGRCLPEGLMALMVKSWTRVPYICFAHGEEMNYASASRELRWLTRRVLVGADLVIANSRNTRRILIDEWNLPSKRVPVLHPGVDTKRFAPAERDVAFRSRMGWGERPVLLTAGRLQQRKGHDILIRALESIRRAFPDVLYVIVGDGEQRKTLEGMVASADLGQHVQFLGETDDVTLVSCYQQCDLFVLPNRQVGPDIEGFGMVLVEAQACGRPVIAGASGGTAETMRIPETGRVITCDAPHQLASLAIELLANRPLLDRMGTAGRHWVQTQFDWEELSSQALRIFTTGRKPFRAFSVSLSCVSCVLEAVKSFRG